MSASSSLSNAAVAAGARAFNRHHRDSCYPETMSGEGETAACEIYDAMVAAAAPQPLSHLDRFPLCAPGDSQDDAWLLRFDDADRRDCIWRGPDAEAQARAKWEEMCGPSGSWNGYLFQLARREPQPVDAVLAAAERVRSFLSVAAKSSSFRADQIASIGFDPLLQSDLQLLVDAIAKRAAND